MGWSGKKLSQVAVTGNSFYPHSSGGGSLNRQGKNEIILERMLIFQLNLSCYGYSVLPPPQRMPLTTDLFSMRFYSRLETPDLFAYGLKYIFNENKLPKERTID